MAYSFDGTDDKVRFDIAPLNGYTAGPLTMALYAKLSSTDGGRNLVLVTTSGGSPQQLFRQVWGQLGMQNASSTSSTGATVLSTGVWYILVATRGSGTVAPRFHIWNGTSWTHENGDNTNQPDATIGSSDGLAVGGYPFHTIQPFAGDIVCAGIKKTNALDATVETLSPTEFSAWTGFGFDWLIGFDSSLESGGVLQDQASPGTGDEVAITGTGTASDPAGWAWAVPPPTATHIKFGTGLAVTDEGGGVIRVDVE